MAEDHRGRTVGNPTTPHGGHTPTPRQVQLGRTNYSEYDNRSNSFGVRWNSGDYESQAAENLVYSDGPRAGLPLDIQHLKDLEDNSNPGNMFAVRDANIAFKQDGIVVPDPYGEDVPTDKLARY